MIKNKQLVLPGTPPQELKSFWNSLSSKYSFVDEAGQGKTGIAYRIEDAKTKLPFCLKTLRKSLRGEERKRAANNLKKEVEILLPLRHKSLPEIFDYKFNDSNSFYICTFHPGETFAKFIESGRALNTDNSWAFIALLFDAVEATHKLGRSHCDLHSKNILVGDNILSDGILIIDFGSGHRESDTSPLTENRGNPFLKLGQPTYGQLVERHGATSAFRVYDLVAIGQLLSQGDAILFADSPPVQKAAFRSLYQKLLNQHLTDWRSVKQQLSLVADPFRSVSEMERMIHNSEGRKQLIPIPVYRNAWVGDRSLELINCKSFQRLRGIEQLSFCNWFYPGATHTRFEHSIGVFHLTQLALRELSWNEAFRERYSGDNLKVCLAAALLHDVGHYPFAHMIEHYADSHFPTDIELKRNVSHSKHSISLLRADKELNGALSKIFGRSDVSDSIEHMLEGENDTLCDLLNGPIDCDKLDYLARDALHCGVPFAANIDPEAFVRQLRPFPDCTGLGVGIEAVPALESFLILQEHMLSSVYWHECVRGIICMFHAALAHIVKDNKNTLQIIAEKLKRCPNDREALTKVIIPSLKEASKSEDILSLVSLHDRHSFSDIYRPIAVYRHFDTNPKGKRESMFSQLVAWSPSASGSTIPVKWDSIRILRKAFQEEFEKQNIKTQAFELLIDVPLGKNALRTVSAVAPNGDKIEVSKISHLKETIFSQPAAFASPIRVFVSPRVHELAGERIQRIVSAVQDAFLK